uniref:Alpha-macroglobulin receptor-binding domain-containing protein n=1 Tax=Cyprinus carpio TaxID=7962 RepID=A0A8C1R9D4_CYPCA
MISIVIVDIKLLSGFTIPKNIPMNYQIQMKQVLPVKNLRPAVVKVYDYYQTSKILYSIAPFVTAVLCMLMKF